MKKKTFIVIVTATLLVLSATSFIHKALAEGNTSNNYGLPAPDNIYVTDHELLTAPSGNKTAIWCYYKYNTGETKQVYGGVVDTDQLISGHIKIGCQKN